MPAPPSSFARPAVTIDDVVALDESGLTVSLTLRDDAPCFAGHYPGYPIFPGVFTIEVTHQAARLYCERYFPGGRVVRVGAQFLAPILPGAVMRCECTCKRLQGGSQIQVQGVCKVAGVTVSKVKLNISREPK
jgi:3-hydroxyacyl-[acyl-carrier-protein] dehydratase